MNLPPASDGGGSSREALAGTPDSGDLDAAPDATAYFMRQMEQPVGGEQKAATLLVHQKGWSVLPLAQMDPARKLLAALLFSVGVSLVRHPALSACALIFPLLLCFLGRVPLLSVLRRLVPVLVFCALLWLTLPLGLSLHADTFLQVGPVYIRAAGLWAAFAITAKAVAIAATLLLLAGTTSVTGNARALLRLRVPEKFVTLLLLTYTNLHLAHKEAGHLFDAARLRGFPRRNRYRTYAWLLGMLVIRAVDRATRVQEAMRLRGFQGRFPLLSPVGINHGPSLVLLVRKQCMAGIKRFFLRLWPQKLRVRFSLSNASLPHMAVSQSSLLCPLPQLVEPHQISPSTWRTPFARVFHSAPTTRSARWRAYGHRARQYRALSPVFQAGAKARARRYQQEIAEAVVLGTGVLSASLLVLFDQLVARFV